ncbi:restriction endonuclease subunit S [Streptococcus gordonii]|uniref:restriction endonuclease subunit S n=1 Tax=Streptococcus gordonii TaxID=1302 RepID=UPI0005F34B3F|nr:restriction endonuclease subunit S [Streptococcus gordonii]
MSEWKRYKLSDLYEMSSGISSTKEQAGHGSPFLSFSVVFNNYFLPDNLIDLMDTTDGEKQKYSINEGDIFLTRTSETVDELAMSSVALKDYPEASFSGFLKRLRPVDKTIVYPKFMAFYLRSPLFRRTIINNTVMTLRASFNEAMFSYLEIMLPDFDTQKKIGDFLYSLEKKKQINNQINQELEAMAKTLYDYWFVQFDFPDQNGKPYKSSGGKMVYNQDLKREIPEGWGVTKLNEVVDLISGYPFSSNDYVTSGKYKLYTIKNVQDGYTVDKVDNYLDFLPSNMSDECQLRRGDLIMSLTGNVGRVGMVYEDDVLLNQRVLKLNPINKTHKSFIYSFFRSDVTKAHLENMSTGTSQKNLSPIDIGNMMIPFPSESLLSKFVNNLNMLENNLVENQQLTQLRDWLLPMLMNGQVKME